MAKFVIDAWCGFAEALYQDAIPDRTVQEILEYRCSHAGTTSSIENSLIAEENGSIVGGLHAYPMDLEAADPADLLATNKSPEVFAPFDHLHAEGSYHISAIAVYSTYRRRGIANLLIEEVESEAVAKGFDRMSLHVFAENVSAARLYESFGYCEAARQPVVAHPSLRYGGDLLLMTRTL